MRHKLLQSAAVALTAVLALAGCSAGSSTSSDSSESSADTTVTFRLWDETAAASYEKSFAAFEKQNPGIEVDVEVVPWADYWTELRADVAEGNAADVFWMNNSYFGNYADSGNLIDVDTALGKDAKNDWTPSVVKQFTRDKTLWGVPQTYDAGIAVYYNKKLLDEAGIDPSTLKDLQWNPDEAKDTFLPVAQKLTKDTSGRDRLNGEFDTNAIATFGTNLGYDLQAILLPYIGSNGGQFQDGDDFDFADAKTTEAVEYVVKAVTDKKVAPPASDTNDNSDFSRDAFLEGKIALFQSGLYNLKSIDEGADFEWGVAPAPAGPAGNVTVTNGIVAAGNAQSKHLDATKKVLTWLGSTEGDTYLATDGAALPAVDSAQKVFLDYWKKRDVDVTPFLDAVKAAKPIESPSGVNYAAGFTAYDPIFKQIFAGQTPVSDGLKKAQDAANVAINK
ncbi:ABC transporter substrate-binding protein [Okibacterium fritillariae]|uniref:Carbohydrate ABC transporter substrate-binding protein, CUT1 family n=1 Tax=Okibacterium fritillariae TaxID=123320 RepID=A0A1T5I7L6_9MICO|nr:sugar ABC transporter substrate-binding protein [Okibacterium fritillariae]SKC35139.1 carbohydrate ABC transporter substrate-binding protein, CUT1 family [Okibacterium fritillariae]